MIKHQHKTSSLSGLMLIVLLMLPFHSFSQEEKKEVPDGTDGSTLVVPQVDSTGKATNLQKNEVNTPWSTFKLGLGYIGDYITYTADDVFKQQMDSANLELESMYKTRDFRILSSGKFNTKRVFAWKAAVMYDGDKEEWYWRESGFTIGVPELAGNIFIGRTKEGYSMVKVMNGHSPWGAERQMALDVIPILADGIKYFGFLPKQKIFWNAGYYNDILSEGQGFSTFEWQYDARVGWLPIYDKEKDKVLHIGGNYRYGKPLAGKITLKSRPEANTIPQIINTGSFAAENSTSIGGEIYYSNKRLLLGSEVMVHQFNSTIAGDHKFYGGKVVVTYFLTNTARPYNTTSGIFGFVPVHKSVFKGGWGEWEAVLTVSSLDLDDGDIKGGKFWRITPMVNWYMSKVVRAEFIYGYGELDRYNLTGAVQFFQFRIQFTVM
ncbi:MAG: OprO/OprP family phosphate-selective porin [Bacteroidia bacterium]